MDEAFIPLREMLRNLLDFGGEVADEAAGVRSSIYRCEIDTPIELDVSRDADGKLVIGSVPPLYRVATSLRPSYHRIRITAERDHADDRGADGGCGEDNHGA
jgi:hypothetical protein